MTWFRLHHLAFAATVIAAYLTAESTGIAHAWIGYAAAALLALRVLLGLLRRPAFAFRRLRPSLATPPLGQGGLRHPAIMRTLSLALLLAVAGTAGTGIAMDRGGTLVGQSVRIEREGREDERFEEHEEHEEEGALAEIHETLGNLILPLVLAHLLYMLALRRDLALFMLFVPRRPAAARA